MTSERLNRVTSKIEAAVERLSQLDPSALARPAPGLLEGPAAEDEERHRREIEDRDRKIAKLRADLDDISDLKDREIERLRTALASRPEPERTPAGVDPDEHADLQRRHERLKRAAEATRQRLDALIARMEDADG